MSTETQEGLPILITEGECGKHIHPTTPILKFTSEGDTTGVVICGYDEYSESAKQYIPVPDKHRDLKAALQFIDWARANQRDLTLGYEWLESEARKL